MTIVDLTTSYSVTNDILSSISKLRIFTLQFFGIVIFVVDLLTLFATFLMLTVLPNFQFFGSFRMVFVCLCTRLNESDKILTLLDQFKQ